MSPRTQSILLLVMSLVIGVLLGLLLGGRLHHKRMEEMRMFDRPGMLKGFMLDRLQLEPAAREELDSLLEVYASETSAMIREHRDLLRARMDSLLQALRKSLGPEEYERLHKAFGERQRWLERPPRHRGRPPGPGGPGGPPPDGKDLDHAEPDSTFRQDKGGMQ